jgi:hypothetical protein
MKVVLQLLALVALVAACDACRCASVSVQKRYYSPASTRVVRAVVKARQRPPCTPTTSRCKVVYKLHINQAFKGCLRPSDLKVSTADNSAACGVILEVGTEYLFYLTLDSVPIISTCQGIQRYSDVTAVDRQFLETREVCCNGQCKCSPKLPMVNCFVEPCKVSKAPCEEAVKCGDNYCGGCSAEWFTEDNYPACLRR